MDTLRRTNNTSLTRCFRSLLKPVLAAALVIGLSPSVFSQIVIEDGRLRANFGIDADMYADSLVFGTFSPLTPDSTDDWYESPAEHGKGVIDTVGAGAIKTFLAGAGGGSGTNITFKRGMSELFFTKVESGSVSNGNKQEYLWLDAVYLRDNHSAGNAKDSSVFHTGSNKNMHHPASWTLTTQSTPQKNDIIDFYGHLRRDGPNVSDSLWAFFGISTLSGDGNSYFDVEFYRTEINYSPALGLGNLGSDSGHTQWMFDVDGNITQPGDVIISLDFENGGTVLGGKLYVWVHDSIRSGFNSRPDRPFDMTGLFETWTQNGAAKTSPFGYAEIELKGGSGDAVVFAELNTASVGAGEYGTLSGPQATFDTTFEEDRLSEFGMNMTSVGLDLPNNFAGNCGALFGGVIAKTRSSASFSSELKDWVGPSPFGNVEEANVEITGDTVLNCYNECVTLYAETGVQGGWDLDWFVIDSNGDTTFLSTDDSLVVCEEDLYYVQITIEGGGCTSVDSQQVTSDFTPPTIDSITTTGPVCHDDCNGTATVYASGTGPFLYQWSNGDTGQTADTLCGDSTYTVIVIDSSNGCADTAEVTMPNPDVLGCSGVAPEFNCGYEISCNGATDGSIDLSVTGGWGGYEYFWSNNATTQDLQNIGAGTYTVTVTDAGGCITTCTFELTEPEELTCEITAFQYACGYEISCNGECDGEIEVDVDGGCAPYQYNIGGGNQSSNEFDGLCAGPYTVTVTDANGCITTCNITLTEPEELEITGDVTNVTCFGGDDGEIDITVTGGCEPYSYEWSDQSTDEDRTGLTAGEYCVTVTDANGCEAEECFTVTEPDEQVCEITGPVEHQDMPLCGSEDNCIYVTASGGTPPYTYDWSVSSDGGSWTITSGQDEDTVCFTAGGFGDTATFQVIITDENGCEDTCEIVIWCQGGAFCTYTQGFYGNAGGLTCDSLSTQQVLADILGQGDIYVGVNGTRWLYMTSGDETKIIKRLPGGGPEVAILASEPSNTPQCSEGIAPFDCPGGANLKKYKNTLVAQAMTMSFNMRYDTTLAGLTIGGEYIIVADADSCLYKGAGPVPGTEDTILTDAGLVVTTYLGAGATLQDLLDLANDAIAGIYTPGGPGDPSLIQITQTLGAYNDAFDECRVALGYYTYPPLREGGQPGPQMQEGRDLHVEVAPNPTEGSTTILLESEVDGKVSVRLFDMDGRLVKVVFEGEMTAGQIFSSEIDFRGLAAGQYLYQVVSSGSTQHGRISVIR